ncbi:MAG: aminoacyl-histidine dipeptidase [Planctomycetota bacterium]
MNQAVMELEPSIVWTCFEKLNAVPRPSKKEDRVIQFVKEFGEGLGLETIVDPAGNVIIRKPPTVGMENRKGIILQAHLDMVHQKNADTEFDFDSQGIESLIDGDWVTANGTTLGADNGMGAASIMAVLASTDLEHGPLEGLFTIDEETGMTGAFELQPGVLNGQILLNTDTEDEGELCIGCAGGIDTNVTLNYSPVKLDDLNGTLALKISVTGLKGGHSGCEIHLGRGNANKVMNRILWETRDLGLQISAIDGGSLRNAIPRESFAEVVIAKEREPAFKATVKEMTATIRSELSRTEPNLEVTLETSALPDRVMDSATQAKFLQAIYAAPCGVIRMSDEMPGLVETSTSLARVLVESGNIVIQFLTRSSVESAKKDLSQAIESVFLLAGANVQHDGSYPGWNPNADSEILSQMKSLYEEQFGKSPVVNAVHAGLECGIIGSVYPGLDMISFGPTIKNPHSPDEKCEIASVGKYWKYLTAVLERAPEA